MINDTSIPAYNKAVRNATVAARAGYAAHNRAAVEVATAGLQTAAATLRVALAEWDADPSADPSADNADNAVRVCCEHNRRVSREVREALTAGEARYYEECYSASLSALG